MSTTPGGISPIAQVLETEELIGTIFQTLACLVRQDLRVNLHDWLNSNSSHIKYRGRRPQWTNFFARAALVNRAFFHASVGVLWEHVNDFHPFFALLEPCSTAKRTLENITGGVPVALLERFKFYSSRTKSLTLHSRRTTPEKAWWITYMLNSRTTDDHPFFPALRNLYLQTTDNFSLMIASFVSSRLEYLSFEFDTEPKRKAKQRLLKLVGMVFSGAWPISMLRVLERADRQLLAGLSKLAPLRHIRLLTSQEDIDGIDRELWAHQQVVIQEVEPNWGWDSDPYSEACNRNIERIFPPQDRLRQLQIHGRNGLISKLADSQLSASRAASFQCVDLRVPWDFVPHQDPLAPVTMGKILRANPRVTRLTIEGSNHQARVHGAALRRIQADPTFYSIQPFLASLAACDRLTFLSINRIMFKGGDTLLDILRVVTSLPELRYAVICPFPISREARDFLRPAPFSVLEVIARANIHLRYLSTMVDLHSLKDIPDIPPDCVFHNSMGSLSLHPCDVRGFPKPTVPGQLKIAQYLASIFPRIHAVIRRDLGAGVTGNLSSTPPAQIGFWEPIGHMIAAFQVSRHDQTQTSEVCRKDVGTQTDMTIIEDTS